MFVDLRVGGKLEIDTINGIPANEILGNCGNDIIEDDELVIHVMFKLIFVIFASIHICFRATLISIIYLWKRSMESTSMNTRLILCIRMKAF